MPVDHISFWENESLKTGRMTLRFLMTPHVHHWDSMMIFEITSKSLIMRKEKYQMLGLMLKICSS